MIGPLMTVTAFGSVATQPSWLSMVTSSLSLTGKPPETRNFATSCVPSALIMLLVAFAIWPLAESLSDAVAVCRKPVPLSVSVPPPAQIVVGMTPVSVGGGSIVNPIISLDWQPAGAGFVTLSVYMPGGSAPFGTVNVSVVHS